MKKKKTKSKYRIRKNELRKFEKENKLTKKEKERLHMWVDAGHSAYDLQWLYELREEEELDELLSGLTDKQKDYVYSYCMNFNPFVDEPYFDYERFEELDLKNLPTFEEEEEPEIDLPF
ncbi:MAG: hypothetical protein U0O16_05840 [Holdemanella sp.]|uniref:hypothetical protein n=1 Tax=Holdemanella sp. TaxID=1971762 RepID=UPI002F928F0A